MHTLFRKGTQGRPLLQTFVHIVAEYWPIFDILSPTHSVENS